MPQEYPRGRGREVPGLMETIGKETELLCLRGHSPDKQWLGVVSGIAMKQNSEAEEHGSNVAPLMKTNTLTSTQTNTNYLVSLRPLKNQVGKSNQHHSISSQCAKHVVDLQMKKTVRI